jgi:hypothetical protein
VSTLDDVLRHARTGAAPARIAARLGVDEGLVDAVLDHAARTGRVHRVTDLLGSACAPCPPAGADVPVSCAGCPLVRG